MTSMTHAIMCSCFHEVRRPLLQQSERFDLNATSETICQRAARPAALVRGEQGTQVPCLTIDYLHVRWRSERTWVTRQGDWWSESRLSVIRRIHHFYEIWCIITIMSRTNIELNEDLIRKARKLTRLKTKRQIVDRALELLVRSESRKGILRYYGTGIWKGDLKASRRDRV